ncbi:hypothetical protein TNCV_4316971 [Trichonephila clavipes]|nr:hypothetical protein TNCV_4316971 [Trichonephila clavipes]
MRRPNMSQTCSIGFRSGEYAGHSIRCIVSASSMFTNKPSSMCGREYIILENKGISNGSSVRDDMWSKYLVCTPSARQSAPFQMICRSVRPPMLIPPHTIQPALLYCDLSRTNAGLFRVPLSSIQEHVGCHTRD